MKFINPSHLLGATKHSLAGLVHAFRHEQAFRHEVLLLPVIILLLLLIRPGLLWSCALIAGWCLVMAVELLNSAAEEAFDLISKEWNEHIKAGKDMASAAIFMTLCANGLLWLCMLWSRFIA